MVYVDLDCVLIDSDARYQDEREVAARYGIAPDLYTSCVDELFRRYGNYYAFWRLCGILREHIVDLPERIEGELTVLLDKQYFFPDTIPFLEMFKPPELALVTSGDVAPQWRKMVAHNLCRFFSQVFVEGDKSKVISPAYPSPHFFIDDAPREIERMKQVHPHVICIQARSPASWERVRETAYADFRSDSLLAIGAFIKNYRG